MRSEQDEFFMARALELAENGRGQVSPNPLVGCVIVYKGGIIGEGWHQAYGMAHAEVNAIASVNESDLLKESTFYVTLEPCAHHGQTPPCADLLVKTKIKRVVIGCVDSNPLVGGKGIERLREAGIEVETGVLEPACRRLNARFFSSIEKNRPYIILKWAATIDGFIARSNFDSKWISNFESRTLVHQWRAEEDAILVGTNTAEHDNPKLNVRNWEGKDPIRIVIDKQLRLKDDLNLFDRSQLTLVYNCQKQSEDKNLVYVKLSEERFLEHIIDDLQSRKVQSIIIEGGSKILEAFVRLNLWDEARVFVSEQRFEEGIGAPFLNRAFDEEHEIGTDKLSIYYNE